jgi:hypothetical protein
MIRVLLLKRRKKEVMVDPKLGGQWKVPCLVANAMSHAWWPMEGKGKNTFSPFPISPLTICLNLQLFPLTLRLYSTMVLSHYFRLFFLFLDL